MKRIVVPKNLNHDWVCVYTYPKLDEEKSIIVKEFYKFDLDDQPVDRIFVSYINELDIDNETIAKCLDGVQSNWLQCCSIENSGQTHTKISSYEHMITKDGLKTYLTFGTNYYL